MTVTRKNIERLLQQAPARGRRLGAVLRQRLGSGIRTDNMVWIFGTGRTGSTWLAAMMEEIKGHRVWFEPRVGDVFNPERFERYRGHHFILGPPYRKVWLKSIRNFVLDGAKARFPELKRDGYLMIKEPGGSTGASLLMEAIPESRMILLIRDPRDVVASWLDAVRKDGWQSERARGGQQQDPLADRNPNAFVKRHAEAYLRNVGNAKEAFEAHKGRKAILKYEDLRADTLGALRRTYSTLDIPVNEGELARAVEKHAWENIPEKDKGEGKFYRKARPGGWKEDLTPKQVGLVEEVTEPLLKEFYPGIR